MNKVKQDEHLVLLGWRHLHVSAFESGGGEMYAGSSLETYEIDGELYYDFGDDDPPVSYIHADFYTALVRPLLGIVGINAEDFPDAESLHGAAKDQLIEVCLARAEETWALIDKLRTYSEVQVAYLDFASIHDWPFSPIPKFEPDRPAVAAKHGLALVRLADAKNLDYLIWGLALIGWSWFASWTIGDCLVCFRRSAPGTEFCSEHSQANVTGREKARQFRKYRLAKKVIALANQRYTGKFGEYRAVPRYETAHGRFAQLLYGPLMQPSESDFKLLDQALMLCPRVCSRIELTQSPNNNFNSLTDLLRKRLDPLEPDDTSWLGKILRAEKWFALEEEVLARRRGKGKVAIALVQEAIRLAEIGLSKSGVASSLDVSRSRLSNWLQRYPALKDAFDSR